MKNSILYFLNILSNSSFDENYSWKDLELKTIYNLNIGDIIDLRNESCSEEIKKEFNTCLFKIINKKFIADSNNQIHGGVILLDLKSCESISLYKNIGDMKVSAFSFSVRALNVMKTQQIYYIKDLLDYTFNREKYASNWGEKTINEVTEFIAKYKLR